MASSSAQPLEFRDRSMLATARRHPRLASGMLWLAVLGITGLLFGDPTWFIFALLLEPFLIGWLVFARRDDYLTLDESGITDNQAHLTRHWDWDEVAAIGIGSKGLRGAPLIACRFGDPLPRYIGGFRPKASEAEGVIRSIADAGWPVFDGNPSWDWSVDPRSRIERA